MNEKDLTLGWIKLGGICGIAAMVFYVLMVAVPVPDQLGVALSACFGPLLALASYGLYRLLSIHRKTVSLQIAPVSNALAGALVTAMLLVQLAIRTGGRGSLDDFLWLKLRRVDLGLDVAWDVYISLGTLLLAVNMLGHPRFGKIWGIIGVALGAGLAVLNLATFPTPPANAGLFDLGPFAGLWYTAVSVQALRSIGWAGSRFAGSEAHAAAA